MTPNIGPKKDASVSNTLKDSPWLNIDSQKKDTNNANKIITAPELFKFKELGKKLIKVF